MKAMFFLAEVCTGEGEGEGEGLRGTAGVAMGLVVTSRLFYSNTDGMIPIQQLLKIEFRNETRGEIMR